MGVPVTAHGRWHFDNADIVIQGFVPLVYWRLQPVAVRAAKPERFGHFNLIFVYLGSYRRLKQRVVLTFYQLLGTYRSRQAKTSKRDHQRFQHNEHSPNKRPTKVSL
jgi:hypothetical protein